MEAETIEQTATPELEDDVKDAWDAESSESESEEVSATSGTISDISLSALNCSWVATTMNFF